MLLIGLALFFIASICALFTTQISTLIACRVAQGLGSATASVNAKTILTDTFSGDPLRKATSYLLVFWALGPVLGPVIGAYLQFHFGWHANFIFYGIYSALLFVAILFCLKETLEAPSHVSLNSIKKNLTCILHHRRFVTGTCLQGLNYCLLVVFSITTTFVIQHPPLNLPSTVFGHLAFIAGFSYLLGALLNRTLIQRFSANVMTKLSLLALAFTVLTSCLVGYTEPNLTVTKISTVSAGLLFFSGLLAPTMMSDILKIFPLMAGAANAVLGSLISIIAFTVTASLSLFHANNFLQYSLSYLAVIGLMTLIWAVLWRYPEA